MSDQSVSKQTLEINKPLYDLFKRLTSNWKSLTLTFSPWHKGLDIDINAEAKVTKAQREKLEELAGEWFYDFEDGAVQYTTLELYFTNEDGELSALASYSNNLLDNGEIEWDRDRLMETVAKSTGTDPKEIADHDSGWSISFSIGKTGAKDAKVANFQLLDNGTGKRVRLKKDVLAKLQKVILEQVDSSISRQLQAMGNIYAQMDMPSYFLEVDDGMPTCLLEDGDADMSFVAGK